MLPYHTAIAWPSALTGRVAVAIVACHHFKDAKPRTNASKAEAPPMKLPPFEYACPATINEAVALLANHGGEAKPLAGGQSLMPMMAFRIAQPSLLVDLRKLPGLKEIKIGADGVRLGALVRWRDILDDRRLTAAHPLLQEAVSHVAHYQIRNRGTVGGSLRARRSGVGDARHCTDLRCGDRGDRQGRRAHHQGRRFLPGRAHHRARARRDHHRGASAGVARRAALRLPGVRPPPRRFRHGRRRALLRHGRRQGRQRPYRRVRRRRLPAPPGESRSARSTAIRSTRRSPSRSARRLPPRSSRRRTSTPAPPTGARSPARSPSARSKPRRRGRHMTTKFEVNGKQVSVDVEPRLTLADCLRHELRLTGTHIGCEHGVCGACTVLVDGEAVRSCLILAVQAEGTQDHHRRGPVQRRRPDAAAEILPQASRAAMRLLHAGLHHHGACAAHRGAGLRRRPRARGAVRQHLPLHRLHRHRRRGAGSARRVQEVTP